MGELVRHLEKLCLASLRGAITPMSGQKRRIAIESRIAIFLLAMMISVQSAAHDGIETIKAQYDSIDLPNFVTAWSKEDFQTLARVWSLLDKYIVLNVTKEHSVDPRSIKNIVTQFDDDLTVKAISLDSQTTVVGINWEEPDLGHLLVVSLPPNQPVRAWVADLNSLSPKVVQGWGSTSPGLGSIVALPDDTEGNHRFFVDAFRYQPAGGLRGGQLSIWRWNGRAGKPLFSQEYAYDIEMDPAGASLDGDTISIRHEGVFKTLRYCAICGGHQMIRRVRITAHGIADLGEESMTPELDLIDALFTRIRDGKAVDRLASLTAAATATKYWRDWEQEWGENPIFFVQKDQIRQDGNRKSLCLSVTKGNFLSNEETDPIVFSFSQDNDRLAIIGANLAPAGCP